MSYYHHKRYRNYRKPNYYYHNNSNDTFNFWKWVFIILGSYYIIIFISSNKYLLLGIVVILIIIFIFWKYTKHINTKTDLGSKNITQEQITELNSERHGCKCYMTGLTEGEQEVADLLSKELSYKDYFIFNNLTIPATLNGSSQIDHLVISKFGIFVIENKDYKGWIFGGKDEDNWTQSLPGGTKKFQFQNPIRQNWSHIAALQDLLPFISKESFESIIVFMFYPNLKTPIIENVVHSVELTKYIQKFTQNRLSEENIHTIIGKLSYMCQTVDISPSQHIENLKSHHNNI